MSFNWLQLSGGTSTGGCSNKHLLLSPTAWNKAEDAANVEGMDQQQPHNFSRRANQVVIIKKKKKKPVVINFWIHTAAQPDPPGTKSLWVHSGLPGQEPLPVTALTCGWPVKAAFRIKNNNNNLISPPTLPKNRRKELVRGRSHCLMVFAGGEKEREG